MSVPTQFRSTLCRTYNTLCISVRQPITEVKAEWKRSGRRMGDWDDLSTQKRRSISQSPQATPVLRYSLTLFLYISEQEGFS